MPRERSPAEVQAEARSEEAILPAWDRGANPRPLEPDTSVERRVINDDYWVHQRVNRLRGASSTTSRLARSPSTSPPRARDSGIHRRRSSF